MLLNFPQPHQPLMISAPLFHCFWGLKSVPTPRAINIRILRILEKLLNYPVNYLIFTQVAQAVTIANNQDSCWMINQYFRESSLLSRETHSSLNFNSLRYTRKLGMSPQKREKIPAAFDCSNRGEKKDARNY